MSLYDEVQAEPIDFRDMTTLDGHPTAAEEREHDHELEILADHDLALAEDAPRSEQLVGAQAVARELNHRAGDEGWRLSGGTSGHEAEHPGPERPPAGTSGWEAEQKHPAETGERQEKGENP